MARVVILEGDTEHDVFEVVDVGETAIRVRAAYAFERGEELTVRVGEPEPRELTVRVRTVGADRVVELEVVTE